MEIIVHEDQAHLLMAVKWDIRGGKGGQLGQHGRPGQGGIRGKGGKGHEWYVYSLKYILETGILIATAHREERVGYIYSCTDRCAGVTSNTSSLVRLKSKAHRRR